MNGRRALPAESIGPDDLIRLDVAAATAFRDGSIKLSTLRREAARGRLTVWRIANKDMTTLTEVKKMVDRCLRAPNQPDFGSDRPIISDPPPGSSSTVDVKSAQAALEMRIRKLSESSQNTSPASTTPRRRQNVVPIKPR